LAVIDLAKLVTLMLDSLPNHQAENLVRDELAVFVGSGNINYLI
jgi:hypothetical protein